MFTRVDADNILKLQAGNINYDCNGYETTVGFHGKLYKDAGAGRSREKSRTGRAGAGVIQGRADMYCRQRDGTGWHGAKKRGTDAAIFIII